MLKRRIVVAAAFCVAWAVAIEGRLVYLQVIEHDFLIKEAKKQQEDTVILEPKRGDILDRDGGLLAFDVDADSIYAAPHEIEKPAETVAALCAALDDGCTKEIRDGYVSRINKRDENGRIACVLRERPAGRRFDADAVARAEVATVSAGARARCDGECRRSDGDRDDGGDGGNAHAPPV